MSFSKQAFRLRKSGDLNGALQAARAGITEDSYDEWNQRALGWVLFDLIKKVLSEGNKTAAKVFFDEASSLKEATNDDTLRQQLQRLAPKVSIHGKTIEEADALFKSGNFEGALEKFRLGILDFPKNEKVHEQYGWCVYRLIRQKWSEFDNLIKRKFLKEYLDLKNPRPSLLHSQFLNQAAKLSDEGEIKLFEFLKLWGPQNLRSEDWDKSYRGEEEFPALANRILRRIFRSGHDFSLQWLEESLEGSPGSPWFGSGNEVFARYSKWAFWELWKANKENRGVSFNSILQGYRKRGPFQPSEFHSKILAFVAKKAADYPGTDLVGLLFDSGFESLSGIDFKDQEYEGKKIPGIAEKVSQKAAKLVVQVEHSSDEIRSKMVSWLDAAIEKLPEGIWLYQNRGKLKRQLGQPEVAILDFKKVLKFKPREYWAWEALGDCLDIENPELAIACYCKALSFKTQEGFIANLRLKLAKLLIEENQFNEAKTEIEAYFRHKEKDNSRIAPEAGEWRKQKWYEKASLEKYNLDLYNSNGGLALRYLFEDLPWIECNMIKVISLENKSDLCLFGFTEDAKTQTFLVRLDDWRFLKNKKAGQSIRVKAEVEKDRKTQFNFLRSSVKKKIIFPKIIELREGELWDSIQYKIGVIDHVNLEKGIAHVMVSKHSDCLIHLRRDDKLDLGQFVAIRTYQREKDTKTFSELLTWELTRKKPSDSVYYEFSGEVSKRNDQSFAFISGMRAVFIPPDLVRKANLVDGEIAKGTAILSYNKSKGSWGWKCFCLLGFE